MKESPVSKESLHTDFLQMRMNIVIAAAKKRMEAEWNNSPIFDTRHHPQFRLGHATAREEALRALDRLRDGKSSDNNDPP